LTASRPPTSEQGRTPRRIVRHAVSHMTLHDLFDERLQLVVEIRLQLLLSKQQVAAGS
jgi:hypothetical protein